MDSTPASPTGEGRPSGRVPGPEGPSELTGPFPRRVGASKWDAPECECFPSPRAGGERSRGSPRGDAPPPQGREGSLATDWGKKNPVLPLTFYAHKAAQTRGLEGSFAEVRSPFSADYKGTRGPSQRTWRDETLDTDLPL